MELNKKKADTAKSIRLYLLIIFMLAGLFTKTYSGFGDLFLSNYFGGVIYVVFFVILASLFFPLVSPLKISIIVLTLTCLIEVSQLIKVNFLSNLREHFLVKILIGSVYNSLDFVFYCLGAVLGFGILSLIGPSAEK
jgi:hypothetical protein